jgi:hypothetical protein
VSTPDGASWELASPTYFEDRVDPSGEMDPDQRTRLARERYDEAVREAEQDVAEIGERSRR